MTNLIAGGEPIVVVTGANGLVGARVCAALADRGATVRALVRRPGTAPGLPAVEEVVGDFTDADAAAGVLAGADAAITTVHPMGADRGTQERIGVIGTSAFATAAADAGVDLLVHVSTCAVYERSPGAGDVEESSALVGDDGGDYAVTKRDTDAALAAVGGLTRVLVRPPAILGVSESSVWNSLRPQAMRTDERARRAVPGASWPWVHVDDLARLLADVATGRIAVSVEGSTGPEVGACTPVNVAAPAATWRDYVGAVTAALDVEPVWSDSPAWTGQILTDRARAWGWSPEVSLESALAELADGLA